MLRILHLEDDPIDADLALELLRDGGLEVESDRIDTLLEFRAQLESGVHALILSDFSIPGLDVMEALKVAHELRPEVPFVLLTGAIGEDVAVETLKLGATDCVLKQRISRLVPSVRRALNEAEEYARRREAEAALDRTQNQLKVHAENLQSALEFFTGAFDTVREPILMLDVDLRVVMANRAFYQVFEVRPAATEGELVFNLGNGQWDIPALRELLDLILPGNTHFDDFEMKHRFERIGERTMLLNARKLFYEGEKILLAIEDVTERRRGEAAKSFLASVVESSDDSIMTINFDEIITSWNKAAERLYGFRQEEVLGKSLSMITFPEDMKRLLTSLGKIRQGQEVDIFQAKSVQKEGDLLWLSVKVSPVKDAKGHVIGVATIGRDITERLRTEKALGDAAARLQSIITSAMDAIILIDSGQRVVLFNPAAEKMFGVAVDEALGKSVNEFFPEQFRDAGSLGESGLSTNRTGALSKVNGMRGNGEVFPIEAAISKVEVGGNKVFTALLRDITERTRAEERQGRLAAIVDSSEDAIISNDLVGLIQSWNAGAERLFGFNSAEMIGQPLTMIIPPELREEERRVLEKVRSGELVQHFETVRMAKDGSRIDVSLTISPVLNAAGVVVGASKICRDVTDLVQAREVLTRSREELEILVQERTSKLQEVIGDLEHFSYTITHDMRAPLRAMKGFSDVLLEESALGFSASQKELLRRIAEAADRMDHLITDSLDYSHAVKEELMLEPIDAGALLRGIVESYPQFQPPGAEVEIDPDIPPLLANEAGLTQCFSNLLNNAVKFVETGKVPLVRVWAECLSREPGDAESEEPCKFIRLWFEDNGIGIAKEQQNKVFGMFNRVSKDFEGTGIGLALVRKVAERMRGRVGVESEPGEGCRFWLEFKGAEIVVKCAEPMQDSIR